VYNSVTPRAFSGRHVNTRTSLLPPVTSRLVVLAYQNVNVSTAHINKKTLQYNSTHFCELVVQINSFNKYSSQLNLNRNI